MVVFEPSKLTSSNSLVDDHMFVTSGGLVNDSHHNHTGHNVNFDDTTSTVAHSPPLTTASPLPNPPLDSDQTVPSSTDDDPNNVSSNEPLVEKYFNADELDPIIIGRKTDDHEDTFQLNTLKEASNQGFENGE